MTYVWSGGLHALHCGEKRLQAAAWLNRHISSISLEDHRQRLRPVVYGLYHERPTPR